jgi:hypothetical protein
MPTTDRDHLLDTLTQGIEALTTSDAWRTHLEVQSRFHSYSFSNALLIVAQNDTRRRIRHLEEARAHSRERGAGRLDPGSDGRKTHSDR